MLAEVADLLGADSQDVLFSGQASVPTLVAEDSTEIVLVLLLAKALGLRDQPRLRLPRRPGLPGHLPRHRAGDARRSSWFDVSPTLAVAVGAAAGMAAMTGLLLTAMLFAALLVGRQGLDAVPAAVLAAAAAWLTIAGAASVIRATASTAATR